jgi:hypothetical protein
VFNFLKNENVAQGLPPTSLVQAGVSNFDRAQAPEQGKRLPWSIDPATSWLDYSSSIACRLDSGMVLHKPLPQPRSSGMGPFTPDTLASCYISPQDSNLDANIHGVNTISQGGYTDIIQQMASPDWRFLLYGFGLRMGYQVPVPGIKTVAGVPATPTIQWTSGNVIVANFSGIPVFRCEWRLYYIVSLPPTSPQTPPPNMAERIRGDQILPAGVGIQIPFSQPDPNAVQQNTLRGGIGFSTIPR